jgi:membrane protease YdiL (CAAX protease family)
MWTFDYTAHRAFVAPAAEKSQIWRLFLGQILIIGVFVGAGSLIYLFIFEGLSLLNVDIDVANILSLLFSFGAVTAGVFTTVFFVHGCRPDIVFGPLRRASGHFVLVSLGVCILLIVLGILPPWGFGEPLIANRLFLPWLLVLPVALFSILIQTSAEEILFRGYLQQQLGARFASPWIWMALPSVLFGLAHFDPQSAGENAWIVVAWATFFGVAMADLTARAGNLGPVIAVHFINNITALLIVAVPGEFGAAALYVLPFDMTDVEMMRAWLPVDFATTFVMWLVARLIIRR